MSREGEWSKTLKDDLVLGKELLCACCARLWEILSGEDTEVGRLYGNECSSVTTHGDLSSDISIPEFFASP